MPVYLSAKHPKTRSREPQTFIVLIKKNKILISYPQMYQNYPLNFLKAKNHSDLLYHFKTKLNHADARRADPEQHAELL